MTLHSQTQITNEYEHTELGLIPKDWSVETLNSVINVYRGGSPRPIEAYLTKSLNGINWVKIGDVKDGAKYIESTEEKIIPEGITKSRQVYSGDFLLSNSMSFGRPYILKIDGCIHDGWLVLQNYQNTYDKEFLYYILSSRIVITQYLSKAAGSSVLNLNKELVSSVKLPTPKLPEQKKIAASLSDIDSLIEKLEKLIAKKEAIKRGAMQELLSGKRRLSGFSGEWKEVNMVNSSTLKARIGWQGLTTAEYLSDGDYFLVTGTDFEQGRINWEKCCFVDRERYIQDKNIQLKVKDILLTKDGTIGKVSYIDVLPGPTTLNSGVFVVRPKNGTYIPLFLYYILSSYIFDNFLTKLQAGSTISHLYQKDFINFSFMAPDIKEQETISEILLDMDKELEMLEKKLDKYKQLKQGAMEALLTGKVRLVKN